MRRNAIVTRHEASGILWAIGLVAVAALALRRWERSSATEGDETRPTRRGWDRY